MTKSIMYTDTDRGGSNRALFPSKPEDLRTCLSNGTLKCLEKHIGLIPNDKKCLKVEGVRPDDYAQYKACISEARSDEWKEISEEEKVNGSLRSTRSVELTKLVTTDYTVDITVCSCTGYLCNNHRREHLDSAEVVNVKIKESSVGSAIRLVTRPKLIFTIVFTVLIFYVRK